jgi:hypothetical protein
MTRRVHHTDDFKPSVETIRERYANGDYSPEIVDTIGVLLDRIESLEFFERVINEQLQNEILNGND